VQRTTGSGSRRGYDEQSDRRGEHQTKQQGNTPNLSEWTGRVNLPRNLSRGQETGTGRSLSSGPGDR
jgi:hypothetical protein